MHRKRLLGIIKSDRNWVKPDLGKYSDDETLAICFDEHKSQEVCFLSDEDIVALGKVVEDDPCIRRVYADRLLVRSMLQRAA